MLSRFLCSNDSISFYDNNNSSGNGLSIGYWYIDNPAYISPANYISNPYTDSYITTLNSGTHTINYKIEDQNGCRDSLGKTLQVVDVPNAYFETVDSICVNDSLLLYVDTNLSTGYITNYFWEITDINNVSQWSFNDSSSSLPNFPSLSQGFSPTTYYISLTVSNCCGESTFIDKLVIDPIPHVFFTTNLSVILVQQLIYLYKVILQFLSIILLTQLILTL